MILKIHLQKMDFWDPVKEEFVVYPEEDVSLNHCLLAVSKWEEIWKKPFLTPPQMKRQLTIEELHSYIECMVEGEIPKNFIERLSFENQEKIGEYIKDSKTATTISKQGSKTNSEILTSEVLYFYLSAFQMPFDICERWHLSRLLTLIEVASIKNSPPKKMSKRSIMQQNHALNKARKARH